MAFDQDGARAKRNHCVAQAIGAGPIGLATVAGLQGRRIGCDISARHPQQKEAAQELGAGLEPDGVYDVVVDAVGTTDSLSQAVIMVKIKVVFDVFK